MSLIVIGSKSLINRNKILVTSNVLVVVAFCLCYFIKNTKTSFSVFQFILKYELHNVIPSNYFIATFPGATGLIYKNSDSNKFISIPKDTNGNFRWEWNPNIFYDLIYADRMKISGIGDLLSHLSLLISNFSKSFIVIFIK
ncbi:unnamed protein product [Rotaria magnacalcarata]